MTALVSREPVGLTFDVRMRFMVFTATLALPLLSGKYADDNRCRIPQLFRNALNSFDSYGGLPSDAISSGIPKVLKYRRRIFLTVAAFDEARRQATSVQPEKRSA